MMKKVAAVHDLSGCGRSSLTAVIPILSAMRAHVCPVPTAVLSTITGYFEGYTRTDLTDVLPDYIAHWESLGLSFDSIFTGFLGSRAQIDTMKEMIDRFPSPLVLVDPVFGDDGALYSGFDLDFVDKMQSLVAKADIITPNLTEAAMLLGKEIPETLSKNEAYEWLLALTEKGPHSAVITGITDGEHIHTALLDTLRGEYTYLTAPRIPACYPGTGDVFASVLLGGLLQGKTLAQSGRVAAEFVSDALRLAMETSAPARDGLPFELLLSTLMEDTNE